jgi:predicted AAA+ superfamily ATPase
MIDAYAAHYGLVSKGGELQARALAWAAMRGSRSGRVAWQFIQDVAGELGKKLG